MCLKGKREYEEEELAKEVDDYVDNIIFKPFTKKERTDYEGPATLGQSIALREDFYAYTYLYMLRRSYFFE